MIMSLIVTIESTFYCEESVRLKQKDCLFSVKERVS